MHEYGISYALIVAILFLSIRLSINMFDWKSPPSRGIRMAVDLTFGALFLLGGIISLINFDLIKIIPIIIIFFTAILLISIGFIEPNKNFFILISVSGVTYFSFFILFYNLMLNSPLLYELYYIGLFSAGFSLFITIGVVIVLNIVLKRKLPENQEPLWQINKFWEIINNKYLLVILMIISMLELPFQLRSQSLILYFFQL
ncbi:MAG: hypothetical protein ACTSRG_00895 [Candidatus Helarchaeota archaeon]